MDVANILTLVEDIGDVVKHLARLSKTRMPAKYNRTDPLLQPGDLVYLSTNKGSHIRSQKYKHLRDQRLGSFKIICKVGINSYKL
jgi:hypothetical protein